MTWQQGHGYLTEGRTSFGGEIWTLDLRLLVALLFTVSSNYQDFARGYDLSVLEYPDQRRLVLSGTVAQLNAAFGIDLAVYEYLDGRYRGRIGEIRIPSDLAEIVEAVLGSDTRKQAFAHFRISARTRVRLERSVTAAEVGRLYNFPVSVNGSGQCIAIIELGGGSSTQGLQESKDLREFFGGSMPDIESVLVDEMDAPIDEAERGEMLLDNEVAGSIAPGAKIVVYFAPNNDAGFIDAVKTAIHDPKNRPSVISISWGQAELLWTRQGQRAMTESFMDAATLGITVCCASGDYGSSDLQESLGDGRLHVDFPSSSPFALACGGTMLQASDVVMRREVVWNEGPDGASGGGISDFFDLPQWQAVAGVPPSGNPGSRRGRGVPDVAGDAARSSGYQILANGQRGVAFGTSAVAPLWAGLITLLNQRLGRIGYLNPLLYRLPTASGVFNEITEGNNDGPVADSIARAAGGTLAPA
jgi:kumamolisin